MWTRRFAYRRVSALLAVTLPLVCWDSWNSASPAFPSAESFTVRQSTDGGGVWESNPPTRVPAGRTGFEDQTEHQSRSAPANLRNSAVQGAARRSTGKCVRPEPLRSHGLPGATDAGGYSSARIPGAATLPPSGDDCNSSSSQRFSSHRKVSASSRRIRAKRNRTSGRP